MLRDESTREERDKDLVTFRHGAKRRYWSTFAIGLALFVGARAGLSEVSTLTMAIMFIVALALNFGLTTIATGSGSYRWWYRYLFALLDVTLISSMVAVFGRPGIALVYFLAIVPYSFDRGLGLGRFTAAASTLGFLAASWIFARVHPDAAPSLVDVGIVATLLLIVSLQVIPIPSKLIRRIRATRDRMSEAEHGNLLVRADAKYADELGFLERSFNAMLEEMGAIIGAVQREADETAAFAEQLALATGTLHRSGGEFAQAARDLSQKVATQREHTEEGTRRAGAARESSDRLRDQAQGMEGGARELVEAAESSQAAMGRASETLRAIGENVRGTARTVRSLGDASEQVGEFVDAVSRIARQTNLLALNAAIEAARAGEQGRGFAVVAEEVRKLAEESSRAAKDIARTITSVRDDIAAAVRAMDEGERQVRDVGSVASGADQALSRLTAGIGRLAEAIGDAGRVSRDQSEAMGALSDAIRSVDAVSVEAATRASQAASSATQQTASIESLTRTSQQLAQLSDRLRQSISRFAVSALPHTTEFRTRG